jgi:Eukaryotic aspartyl protease
VKGQALGFTGKTMLLDTAIREPLSELDVNSLAYFYMSLDDAQTFHLALTGDSSNNGSSFSIPCNLTVDVAMVLGGVQFSFSYLDYMDPSSPDGYGMCGSNIIGITDLPYWVAGANFLRNVSTHAILEPG